MGAVLFGFAFFLFVSLFLKKHQGRENNGNDRQLKKPSISRQILLFSIVEKCGRQYGNMHVDIKELGDKRPCY